jgi:hypothetical protein
MNPDNIARRRAVEALRSGVPSRAAVAALGSGQDEIEDAFEALLDRGVGGRLIGGGFGVGKSHLLTHLAAVAHKQGFVVSTVAISKETPLHDPAKVYRAAVESMTSPARVPGVLAEAAAALDPDSSSYNELVRWLHSDAVSDRFAASLVVHERLGSSDAPDANETLEAIVRFWAGDPLRTPDLRRALKAIGQGGVYGLAAVPARELARQRWAFTSRLLRAAGHAGWVLLLDEVELIGRYSLLQRGKSYAEIARWLGADAGPQVATVLAMTDDFEAAVLVGKGDRETLPRKLLDKQSEEWAETAALAEGGMKAISRDLLLMTAPSAADLDRAYLTLKELHAAAYNWSPPDVAGIERLGATRMRQYVRAWINEWDLVREDPLYSPSTEVVEVVSSYDEDVDEDDPDTP